MKDAIITAAFLGAWAVVAHEARAQDYGPSTPAPALPAPLPEPLPAPASKPATPAAAPRPPTIKLAETHQEIRPIERGIGNAEYEKIAVKASDATLTATLGASSNAYGYVLHHSAGTATLRVVQEFEVVAGSPSRPNVRLTLAGQISGFVRADPQGSACLRTAAAAVVPACGGLPLTAIALPGFCTPGCGAWPVESDETAPPVTVPAGNYLLVADLVIEAAADGFNRGHGEAAFSPDAPLSIWSPPYAADPGFDRKAFGFKVTLKAAAAR